MELNIKHSAILEANMVCWQLVFYGPNEEAKLIPPIPISPGPFSIPGFVGSLDVGHRFDGDEEVQNGISLAATAREGAGSVKSRLGLSTGLKEFFWVCRGLRLLGVRLR